MPNEDLLVLLSVCNSIRPQLLVDVLVSATRKHPELPIFKSPDWAVPFGQRPNPAVPVDDAPLQPGPKPKVKGKPGPKRRVVPVPVAPVADPTDGDEEVLPPLWPQPGAGLYAMLPSEKADWKYLEEENDEAFSHFMVVVKGNQIVTVP